MILYEIDGLKLAVNISESESNTKHECGFKALNLLMLSLKSLSKRYQFASALAYTSSLGPEGRWPRIGAHGCLVVPPPTLHSD